MENVDWAATGTWVAAAIAAVAAYMAWRQAKAAEGSAGDAANALSAANRQAKAAEDHAKAAADAARELERQANAAERRTADSKQTKQFAVFQQIENKLRPFMHPPSSARGWLLGHSSDEMREILRHQGRKQVDDYFACMDEVAGWVNKGMADEDAVIAKWGDDFAEIWGRHGLDLIAEQRQKNPKVCLEFETLAENCIRRQQ